MAAEQRRCAMKVLLFCDGASNQRALAHKISAQVQLAGIVEVTAPPAGKAGAGRTLSAARLARFAAGLPLRRAWFGMLADYATKYPRFPDVPLTGVSNINAPEVLDLLETVKPDLVLVSGTNLLKAPLISKIQETGRVLNLHTGISPYIKGAPNCTNWCLAIRRFDLIGNSIMWLDTGIDSGNLVATERAPLTGQESLKELHVAVMEHAHSLYTRCLRLLCEGHELANVPQDSLGRGRLFLTKHWTPQQIARATANFYFRYKGEAKRPPKEALLLVSPLDGPVPMA